ncbi:ATPase PAAT isoform X1 [Megalobrama amblycephala]|uniref:ATPase PAAT isoform X1 n=2 Tax=Megalobrama amblycephala TaxID=75352 RepID=UPI00201421FC|nr:ATPase PAAT isoform X1 [Megalobrama amblycephala]
MRMYSSKDSVISARSSWLCSSQKQLCDILITTQENSPNDDCSFDHDMCEAVSLERAEEDSPCVVTLLCSPSSSAVISSLQVVSEARTIEVYSLSGEYCGTCRGEEVQRSHNDGSEDKRHFYRNHLVLESPAASCEVKLLSLGGRSSVAITHVGVGLETLKDKQGGPSADPGIDLQRVQTMMKEMGTTLSPGAQNLMELVQCQQKNKSDMLNGFIPLLMGGGALGCLSRGGVASNASGAESGPNPSSGLEQLLSTSNQMPGAMSALLSSETGTINPDLLPMLQSVCGQVTQLRLEEATSPERKKNGEREGHMCCVGFEKILETVVEKRMDEMERRLKEHLDLRLDALQQRLEITLQQALSHKQHQ